LLTCVLNFAPHCSALLCALLCRGAILKAHLPLEQLEKPDMSKLDIANTPAA